jgi:hypothetical protein
VASPPPPGYANARPDSPYVYVPSYFRTSSFMKVSVSDDDLITQQIVYVLAIACELILSSAHNDVREFSDDQLYLLPVKVHGFDIRRKACISPLTI